MSQDPPSPPAASPPEFVIPEWFQEEDPAEIPAGEPVALPDIFDDLSAVREPGEVVAEPGMSGANPASSQASATQGVTVAPGVTISTPKANAISGTTATPGAEALPPEEAVCRSDPARAQRLFEIASALGFMAGSLRTWDHEGAEGAAHLLASLAAELAGIAATGDRP